VSTQQEWKANSCFFLQPQVWNCFVA
jgi:hypothetical protein